jgi:transcription initiation factor TFIIIB Brf1 subunit/transcription initiation factor TFIIB
VNSHNNITIDDNNNNSLCSICNNNFKTISDPESGEIICNICGIVLSEEKKLPLHPRVREEMTALSHANTTTTTNTNLQYNKNNSNNNILFNIE